MPASEILQIISDRNRLRIGVLHWGRSLTNFLIATVAGALAGAVLAGSALAADIPAKAPPAARRHGRDSTLACRSGPAGRPTTGRPATSLRISVPMRSFRQPAPAARWIASRPGSGAIFGYNLQVATSWVAGVEADFGWADNSKTASPLPGTAGLFFGDPLVGLPTGSVKETWDGSVRGRLGYLVAPATLVYGTGGVAWQRLELNANCTVVPGNAFCFGNASQRDLCDRPGSAGPSAAASSSMIGSNWLVRVDYRYADLGTLSSTRFFTAGVGRDRVRRPLRRKTDVKVRHPSRTQAARFDASTIPHAYAWTSRHPADWHSAVVDSGRRDYADANPSPARACVRRDDEVSQVVFPWHDRSQMNKGFACAYFVWAIFLSAVICSTPALTPPAAAAISTPSLPHFARGAAAGISQAVITQALGGVHAGRGGACLRPAPARHLQQDLRAICLDPRRPRADQHAAGDAAASCARCSRGSSRASACRRRSWSRSGGWRSISARATSASCRCFACSPPWRMIAAAPNCSRANCWRR